MKSYLKQLSNAALGLLCYFTFFIAVNTARAQTPISLNIWSGSPASAAGVSMFTTLPATITPGVAVVNVSQWDRAGVTFNAAGGCYNSRDWQVGGSFATALANNKYIFFTVTNNATTELQITQLFIRSQVSATGPTNVQMQYTIGALTNNFGPVVGTIHTASPEDWTLNDNICLGPGQTVTFKLYGWGGSGAAGTLRINDATSMTAVFATAVTATASNNSPVCAGTQVDFTSTVSGGIPGYTYSWSGPGGFTSALPNPSITSPTTAAAGVYTLTVTDNLSCTTSASPVTTTVTVNSSPAPITGTLTVCPLLTTTLSSTSSGGTWSSSDVATATVDAGGVVTGVAAGTVTITYSIGALCVATAVVTVNTPPNAITGSRSLCQGLTTTLGNTTPGGFWTSSDAAVAPVAVATGVVTGVSTGTATITYTSGTGCIATAIVTVYPFPAAVTGTAVVCVGATTTLANTASGGTWSSSNVAVASVGSLTGIVSGVSAGTANISYILGGGCSSQITVTVNPVPNAITGPTRVCAGNVPTYVNTTPGGTWSSSNVAVATIGSSTGVFAALSAGTTNVSYILPTGCAVSIPVTVNPLPAAITGPAGVCLGATVTLNSTTAGGTWSSSNAAVAPIVSGTGVVTGNALGTATISYTLSATGCFVTRTQTVNPLPGAITGPIAVCPALSVSLTSMPTGGTWTTSNITVATVGFGSGVVTGVAAGTVNVTYTLATGCIATRVQTVHPAPPAAITPLGDTTFCPGDFVILTANTGVALTYQWYQSGVPVSGAASTTYVATATGSYSVQVTNSLGCPWRSAPVAILVNSVTASITVPGGTTTACAASPVILSATAGAGYSYQWLLDGIAIPGATAITHSASASGNYTVYITNATGCSDLSTAVTVTVVPSPVSTVSYSGPLTICDGGSVTISAVAAPGNTYQWYNVLGAIPGATGSFYVATALGSYYVVVTNSFGCSVNSGVSNVAVNPLPDVSISLGGPKVFCAGGSVVLGTVAGVGHSYQWFESGVPIPGAVASSYVATTSGNYRVRITNLATGCSDITHADTVITLVNVPAILALTPASFCWGGSALLSTSVGTVSGLLYQWFYNGVSISGATAATYSAGATGDYHCSVTVIGGCTVITDDISVIEHPLPNPVIYRTGSLLYTETYYNSYQWYRELLLMPGANSFSMPITMNGNYTVRVTDTNNCQSKSLTYVVTNSGGGGSTEVTDVANDRVVIYPNPASGIIHITGREYYRVVLKSVDGRILIDQLKTSSIDVSPFADGLYLLSLYDSNNNQIMTEKITKLSR